MLQEVRLQQVFFPFWHLSQNEDWASAAGAAMATAAKRAMMTVVNCMLICDGDKCRSIGCRKKRRLTYLFVGNLEL